MTTTGDEPTSLERFFALKHSEKVERYWLAERMKMMPLLAATFYAAREDAEKELKQLRQVHWDAIVVELEIRRVA